MKKVIPLIEVTQPIGTFYISALDARTILKIAEINVSRKRFEPACFTSNGSNKCVNGISEYCADPDATFPTPIIIAMNEDLSGCSINSNMMEIDDSKVLGEVIDGQHRLLGIQASEYIDDFVLPVVFMFGLTEEEKAYVFSIINSKQTQFSMSLLYELFDLSDKRSPQKTCHHIARSFNSDEKSPFYKRLKMLGEKEGERVTLSQGGFVKYLLPLISNDPVDDMVKIKRNIKLKDDPELPLRHYFIAEKDNYIYKILLNLFNAIKEVFPEEWDNRKDFVLSNTVGFAGVMQAFPRLHDLGTRQKSLKQSFFVEQFEKVKRELQLNNEDFSTDRCPSEESTVIKIKNIIERAIEKDL